MVSCWRPKLFKHLDSAEPVSTSSAWIAAGFKYGRRCRGAVQHSFKPRSQTLTRGVASSSFSGTRANGFRVFLLDAEAEIKTAV